MQQPRGHLYITPNYHKVLPYPPPPPPCAKGWTGNNNLRPRFPPYPRKRFRRDAHANYSRISHIRKPGSAAECTLNSAIEDPWEELNEAHLKVDHLKIDVNDKVLVKEKDELAWKQQGKEEVRTEHSKKHQSDCSSKDSTS